MLGRLIKHELKATSRLLVPALIVWLAIVIFEKIALTVSHTGTELFLIFSSLILFLASIAVSVVMFVVIILQFYKSQLGNQGYLTFTLPARTETIVLSKVITATIWEIILTLLSILCMIIMLSSEDMAYFSSEILPHLTFINTQFFIMIFINIIVSSVFEIMEIYAAIAIASLFNKYRLLLSFVFYFVFEIITQILNFIVGFIVGTSMEDTLSLMAEEEELTDGMILDFFNEILSEFFSPSSILSSMCLMFLISVVLFFVISGIFKKRLNLQ